MLRAPYVKRAIAHAMRARPASTTTTLPELRILREKDIAELAEMKQSNATIEHLQRAATLAQEAAPAPDPQSPLTRDQYLTCMTAAFTTQFLHTEARVASLLGQGFYTIGPCGEELLAAVGLALPQHDAMALHYRHLGTQIARQLAPGQERYDVASHSFACCIALLHLHKPLSHDAFQCIDSPC